MLYPDFLNRAFQLYFCCYRCQISHPIFFGHYSCVSRPSASFGNLCFFNFTSLETDQLCTKWTRFCYQPKKSNSSPHRERLAHYSRIMCLGCNIRQITVTTSCLNCLAYQHIVACSIYQASWYSQSYLHLRLFYSGTSILLHFGSSDQGFSSLANTIHCFHHLAIMYLNHTNSRAFCFIVCFFLKSAPFSLLL